MIAFLDGKIKFIFNDSCILDVNGVGYKVFTDAQTLQGLKVGEPAELFIHTAVREDAINLFGFKSRETFELFEMLLTVSGIGAKSALSIVSKISASDFAAAVARQDLKFLTRLPGVGKKSAERILLELKDKIQAIKFFPTAEFQPNVIQSTAQDEAAEALEALGYTMAEIESVFRTAPPNLATEQLIKFALKELNRLA
ncbi:MAG: Holliday junction branch migration protein RuvA [Selenomonadaceae bacterium]|nr:Holliday junction branch migration protein RuvA [Selenomonadaceae bacterium]